MFLKGVIIVLLILYHFGNLCKIVIMVSMCPIPGCTFGDRVGGVASLERYRKSRTL